MKGLLRTLRALPVLLGLWLLLIGIGVLAGALVRSAVSGAMSGRGWLDDGHLLGAVAELLVQNPAVASTLVASFLSATILGFLFWIPMAGSLIEALAGHSLTPGAVLSGSRWATAMAVQTLWNWIARGIVLGLLFAIASKVAWVGILIPLAYVSLVVAFDFARTRIVLRGARPFAPVTFLRGWMDAFRAPGLLLIAAVLVACQLGAATLPLWGAAQATDGTATRIIVRLTAFLPLFISAWRISCVITRVESELD